MATFRLTRPRCRGNLERSRQDAVGLQDGPAGRTATAHLRVQRLELLGLEPDVAESQRGLAAAAGVPRSTVVRIEAGTMQPTLPMLQRILIGAGQEMRIRVEPYDDHDDVLDNLAALDPDRAARAKAGADEFAERMRAAP